MKKTLSLLIVTLLVTPLFFLLFRSRISLVSAVGVVCTWGQVSSPNPGPTTNTLHGISAITANDIWAVGTYIGDTGDRPWAIHWNGTSWTTVESPDVVTNFWDVKALATDDVWAVGLDGLIEHWDGATWTVTPRPMPATTSKTLRAVDGIAPNDVWAVGYYLNGSNYQSLILHWDGTAWSITPSPNTNTGVGILYDLAVVSTNDVWAVGYHGLIMHWDGTNWSVVSNPALTADDYLLGVDAVASNDVWAVGYRQINGLAQNIVTHWNGSTWTTIPSPNLGTSHNITHNIFAAAADDIWAVGTYGPGVFIHQNDQAFTMHWDGTQWSVTANPNPSLTTHNLYDLTVVSGYVWAVGSYQGPGAIFTSMLRCSPPNVAPVVNPITVDPNSVVVNSTVTASATFSDGNVGDTHTATWNWGDGNETAGTVTEANGAGSISDSHTYTQTGTYPITLTVTDTSNASTTQTYQYVMVYNPLPVINPITVDVNPIQINSPLTATTTFSDAPTSDTHTAVWDWGDGSQTAGTISESNGSGTVIGVHTYTQTGVYTITLTVTDSENGQALQTYQYVSAYYPTPQGLFSAARIYTSPAGAIIQNPESTGQAKIGVMTKYDGPNPTGKVSMNIKDAQIEFESATISLLVTSGVNATLRGTGSYNGVPNHTFLITGNDDSDTIRLQIKDPVGTVVYDTQPSAADTAEPLTPITGQVIVH